ncbi:SagB/ThcOx family dehydrogenase [uncultured Bacteroides sp.]|uniref:SagB/ThcOx family dehydrogenase n=1 Tax=uncultured Bacteroides sp. TaxID=162156 RepID=UPI002675A30D|nr:SagB/ThcOx family dehydrogenase [uncultured Bacteroides sp.]
MRKVQLLFACLVFSAVTFAADKVIKLPEPNLNRTGTVMKALSERHSTREYASKALSLSDLSDLLWAANGVNRKDSGKRTAPSALNKQDVDVYVVLPEGSYLYDARNHQLNLVAEGDYRGAVAGGQAFVKAAPVSLVLVSDLSRFGDVKNARNSLMGAMDAGIVSQNISIFCSSANLATVPRASMDSAQLKKMLKLKDSQIPMMNHPVGYFK